LDKQELVVRREESLKRYYDEKKEKFKAA